MLDLLDLLSTLWLKPPRGKHWTWWVLLSLWIAFLTVIIVLAGYITVTQLPA
ncbi:MAG: hypothetical protein NWS68_03230 [Erythrobacter sp.]|nr:hypothetical protein [Erythrobacter sp.]